MKYAISYATCAMIVGAIAFEINFPAVMFMRHVSAAVAAAFVN